MDFNFRLDRLDLEGEDGRSSPTPVLQAPLDPVTPIGVGRLSAASGTSSALFSSPLSSTPVVTGRVKSNVEVGLIYSESYEDHYCCGAIQGVSGNRVCCKALGQCTTQSHKKNKVILVDGRLYIRGVKANQLLLEPSLDGYSLSKIKLNDLVNEKRYSNVWITYFENENAQKVLNKEGGLAIDDDEWEDVDMTTLKEISAANDRYRTPAKLKIGSFVGKVKAEVSDAQDDLASFKQVDKVYLDVSEGSMESESSYNIGISNMLKQWDALADNLDILHRGLGVLTVKESSFKLELLDTFVLIEEKINEADSRMKLLISEIGYDVEASDKGSTSIWSGIKALQDEINRVDVQVTLMYETVTNVGTDKARIDALEKDRDNLIREFSVLNNKSTADAVKLATLDKNYKALYAHYMDSMKEISEAIRKINGRRQPGVTFGVGVSGTVDVINLRADHERLKLEVNHLKAGATSTQSGSKAAWRSEIDNLKRKMADLEGSSGQMFVHKRRIFRTKHDVKHWVVAEQIGSAGMFWDLFSTLVCMKPKNQSGRERADESYSAVRTKSTTLENELLASMSHLRPALLFAKSNGALAAMEDGFGACDSHAAWLGSGLDSYSSLMSTHLSGFIDSVNGILDLSTVQGPADDFARDMLDKVDKGWTALLRFTERFFTKLTIVAKFTDKTAWRLLGRCWAAVFEEMRPFRVTLKEIRDTSTAEAKASVIWGVFQQHRILDEFIALRFEAHPAIVRELSLFIITERVDPLTIIKQGERLNAVEATCKTMNKAITDMTTANATQKRNLDNVINDFKQYKLLKK